METTLNIRKKALADDIKDIYAREQKLGVRLEDERREIIRRIKDLEDEILLKNINIDTLYTYKKAPTNRWKNLSR